VITAPKCGTSDQPPGGALPNDGGPCQKGEDVSGAKLPRPATSTAYDVLDRYDEDIHTEKSNGTDSDLNFEAQLWAATDKIRGHMHVSECLP
jgi:hypothetical protein